MSLNRYVYYSAVIGGWAAYLAWLVAEMFLVRGERAVGLTGTLLAGALVGAAVGAGLKLVSGMAGAEWRQQIKSLWPGLVGGGIGGALGGLFGAVLYDKLALPPAVEWLPRALGWMLMGVGIGLAEGIYEQSSRKIRNGLIGGALGGLVGGVLFDRIALVGSDMPSRAVGFVCLGLAVGGMIGLAHVVLKEAWLTVLDGYRPGRQLILTADVTTLGRGDYLPLPFLGYGSREVETEHVRITRRSSGQFLAEDNHTRIGTVVNSQRIDGPVTLRDGDLLRLGSNIVRFNHRRRDASRDDIPIRGIEPPGGPPGGLPRGRPAGSISAPPPPPGGVSPSPSAPPPVGTSPPASRPSPSPPPPGGSPRIPPPPPPPS